MPVLYKALFGLEHHAVYMKLIRGLIFPTLKTYIWCSLFTNSWPVNHGLTLPCCTSKPPHQLVQSLVSGSDVIP